MFGALFSRKKRTQNLLKELDDSMEHDYLAQLQQMLEENKLATVKWLVAAISCGVGALTVSAICSYMMPFFLHATPHLRLIPNFDEGNIFTCIFFIGVISIFINSLGVIVCLANAWQPTNRSLRYSLYSFTGWLAAIVLVSLISLLVCASISFLFDHIFRIGMMSNMLKYVEDKKRMQMINTLQLEQECCGNHDYHEWFNIEYNLNKSTQTSRSVGFPASCCDRQAGECVSESAFMREEVLTPWSKGCFVVLKGLIKSLLVMSEVMLLIIVLLGVFNLSFVIGLSRKDEVYDDFVIYNRERELSKKIRKQKGDRHEQKEYLEMLVSSAKAKEEEKKLKVIKQQAKAKNETSVKMNTMFSMQPKSNQVENIPLDVQLSRNMGVPRSWAGGPRLRGRWMPAFMQGPRMVAPRMMMRGPPMMRGQMMSPHMRMRGPMMMRPPPAEFRPFTRR